MKGLVIIRREFSDDSHRSNIFSWAEGIKGRLRQEDQEEAFISANSELNDDIFGLIDSVHPVGREETTMLPLAQAWSVTNPGLELTMSQYIVIARFFESFQAVMNLSEFGPDTNPDRPRWVTGWVITDFRRIQISVGPEGQLLA